MGSSPWILSMMSIVALFSILLGRELVAAQDTSFVFDSFDCLKDKHVQCTGDSTSTGEEQLNLTGAWMGSVGRALYLPGIRLLDPATSKVSSFSTNFTFSTQGDYPKPGEGLAFVLLSNPSYVGSGGGFLRVYGQDGNAGTPTLAVEFDTFKNGKSGQFTFNDINDNHVGLDLESIKSKVQADAGTCGIVFYKESKVTAWVDYSAPTGNHAGSLQVRISRNSSQPKAPLLSYEVDLSKIFTEYMFVGFSAATGDSCFSFHTILDWGFSSWGIPPPSSPSPPPAPSPPAPPSASPSQSPAFPPPPPNPIVPIIAPVSSPSLGPSPTGAPPTNNAPPPGSGNPSPFPPGPNQGPTSPAAAPPDLAPGPSSNGSAAPPDDLPPTPSSTAAPGPGPNSTPGSGSSSPSPGPLLGPSPSDDDTTIRIVVPIVATLAALAALFACCLAFTCCRKRRRGAVAPPEAAP